MATFEEISAKFNELANAQQAQAAAQQAHEAAAERHRQLISEIAILIKDARPALRRLIIRALSLQAKDEDESKKTNFDRVSDYLRAKGNRPQSVQAIIDGTELKKGAVTQVLYRTHKSKFICTVAPGFQKKKLWSLRGETTETETDPNLFNSLAGKAAHECCEQILREHGNKPMNALSLAREALARGYVGKATGDPDDILMTTAKSFWARMGRNPRFFRITSEKFRLREPDDPPPTNLEESRRDMQEEEN